MSLHYEWILSLRFRADTPDEFVEELRFHLGQVPTRPAAATLEHEDPVFELSGPDSLAGGAMSGLSRQKPFLNHPEVYGLFVRTLVLDDGLDAMLDGVLAWLARWSATQGWIGFAREEMSLQPWLQFYVQDGYAYLAGPGERPQPVEEGSPPFTLTQTVERLRP